MKLNCHISCDLWCNPAQFFTYLWRDILKNWSRCWSLTKITIIFTEINAHEYMLFSVTGLLLTMTVRDYQWTLRVFEHSRTHTNTHTSCSCNPDRGNFLLSIVADVCCENICILKHVSEDSYVVWLPGSDRQDNRLLILALEELADLLCI